MYIEGIVRQGPSGRVVGSTMIGAVANDLEPISFRSLPRSGRTRSVALLAAAAFALALAWAPAALAAASDEAGEAAEADGTSSLNAGEAAILGLIEGLTEYLPVSSTGHLTVAGRLLDIGEGDALDSYVVVIQLGAIIAVIVAFPKRIAQLVQGLIGRSLEGRRLLIAVVAAFLPAAVIGLLLGDLIKDKLFGPGPVAAAWIVGGLALVAFAPRLRPAAGRALEELGPRDALIIGVAQAAALWPGVSRSLVTIVAAVLVGLSLPAAVEFSFVLGLATLGAATLYELAKGGGNVVDAYGWATPVLGMVVAFMSALVAVRWLLSFLTSHDLRPFGWYRLAIGAATVGLMAAGTLS